MLGAASGRGKRPAEGAGDARAHGLYFSAREVRGRPTVVTLALPPPAVVECVGAYPRSAARPVHAMPPLGSGLPGR